MTPPRHLVVTASAGTGKTFRLTGRLIGVLAEGAVDTPESILASTFTRKAAGEILDRLLARLAEASQPTGAAGEQARALLAEHWPGGEAPSAAQALALLAATARRLDRLQVRTLDSWFADVVGWLSAELGLPAGWRLIDEDEDARLRDAAVAALVSEARNSELAALLRLVNQGRARRSVHGALRELADTARTAWLDSAPGAWDRIEPPAGPDDAACAAALAAIEAADIPLTKQGKPHTSWAKAIPKAVAEWREALAGGAWHDLLGKGPLAKMLDESPSYYRVVIPPEFLDPFGAILDRIVHEGVKELCDSLSTLRDLVQKYDAHYSERKWRDGALRFEDLPRRLADPQAGLGASAARLAARLGATTDHLLLDEFQDTSVAQWRALAPVARAARKDGRTLFAVGDVKQAIYGWREGDWRLLDGLAQHLDLATDSMAISYRTSPPVLALVNAVFGDLGDQAVFEEECDRATARRWSGAFEEHVSADKVAGAPGAAHLIEVPSEDAEGAEGAGRDALMRRAVVARIAAMHAEAPDASLGILVRARKPIAALIRALRDAGLPASGEGGNPLTDSEAVLVVLSLLWLVDHPSDTAARFHVETSGLAAALGIDASGDSGDSGDVGDVGDDVGEGDTLTPVLDGLRHKLVDLGYGATLQGLVQSLGEQGLAAWDRDRLAQLVDLGFIVDARPPARVSAFVERVRAETVEDPRADRIRVMTVHGAKGLEFDAVVLPDLESRLVGRLPSLWTLRPEPWEAIDLVFPTVKQALCPYVPRLAALRESVRARAMHESLCVLYVALTRARRRLDVLVRAPAKGDGHATFAHLMRQTLGVDPDGDEGNGEAPEGRVLWSTPPDSRAWHEGLSAADDEIRIEVVPSAFDLAPVTAPRSWPRRAPSSAADDGLAIDDLLAAAGSAARARGTIVHRLCAEIEWIEGPLDPQAMQSAARDEAARNGLSIEDGQLDAWCEECLVLLDQPDMRALLTRPEGEHKVEVWRERRFAVFLDEFGGEGSGGGDGSGDGGGSGAGDGSGERFVTGAFDRVVVRSKDGVAVAAEIIDFKTDRPPVDEAALDGWRVERVRHHAPQMREYGRALAQMLGLPEAGITLRLALLQSGDVLDCEAL